MKKRYFKSGFRKRIGIKTIVTALAVMFAMTGMAVAQEFIPTANISGIKFNDLNHNGILDKGESGIANWTITLTEPGQEIPITTQTDSNGNYTFTRLAAGNYTVGEILLPGWEQTAPAGGTYSVALNGTDVTGKDFGNFNTSQPYLVLITSGGIPNTAVQGSTVSAFGSNFCSAQGCSAINLTIGNEFAGQQTVASLSVQSDGTFATNFTVNVPFPWLYIVTATQTTADGSTLSASEQIAVPISDPKKEIPPPLEGPQILSGVSISGPDPAVAEFPPNIAFDGRSVAVDVSSTNNAIAIAASESGGLWKTTNTGATWSHLDGLLAFRMSDVKLAPGNDQIVIATAWADSHMTNSGGIWRSTDGGSTWSKPPTADPTPGFGCSRLFNAWGISFVPGTNDVFVGTDCGVSFSHDLGATWSHVSLPAVYGINAQRVSGATVVDTFGADGHYRSPNGGSTWNHLSTSPTAPFIGVHTIAASPLEPNVLFAAVDGKRLFESDDGGTSWTNLNPNQPTCCGRGPWVATHLSSDGDPNHFDIYFSGGSGSTGIRQTCTNTGGPGLRCSTSWNTFSADHGDINGLSFSTSGNCAQFIVSDGGIHTTSDCGATWHISGNGAGGYHALQIYEMNGEVHPSHTDLYFGTQDNNLWASGDNGVTWPVGSSVCCEGFYIQTLHNSPTDSGQTITFVACSGCSNLMSAAHFASVGNWNNPPSGGSPTGNPFIIDQGVYIQWNATNPPTNQLYITTNGGGMWTPVTGASTNLQLIDHPFVSGPPANPTIYQEVGRGGRTGLIKITGVRSGTATITNADSGLSNIGFWSMGQGTFRWAQVFAVDANNPQHLMAADVGRNKIMVSTDGGTSWNPDSQLTSLVTNLGQFRFGQTGTTFPGLTTEAHSIAFDPSNSNRILVGTEQAGIIASLDNGATWSKLPSSEIVPAISSFFFDEVQKDVMTSTYGRGLWKLDLSQRATTIVYTGDTTADYHDPANVSGKLTDSNSGQPVATAAITFTIGSQSCTATTDTSGNAVCSIVLDQIPGRYTVVANFAGSGLEQASQTSAPFTITKEQTSLSYTGDTVIANNFNANMSGVLLEDGIVPISGRTVTFTLGTGATVQTCQGTTDNTGMAKCTISPVAQPLGTGVVSAVFTGDAFYIPSSANATTLIFSFPDRGVFVIGDKNSTTGAKVTFWSPIWSTLNLLSGGPAPDSFKGFASNPSTKPPSCGTTWEARPGDSGKPPAAVPSYMGVLVSSKTDKSGSIVSSNTPSIVVVKTNPGYEPDPGHPGTGTEIATFCHI